MTPRLVWPKASQHVHPKWDYLRANLTCCQFDWTVILPSHLSIFSDEVGGLATISVLVWTYLTLTGPQWVHIHLMQAKSSCDLSDVTPCQNMTQGHFMMGVTNKLRLMCNRWKIFWLSAFPFVTPQVPRNKLSVASRQRPGEAAHWGQDVIVSKHNPLVQMPDAQPISPETHQLK